VHHTLAATDWMFVAFCDGAVVWQTLTLLL